MVKPYKNKNLVTPLRKEAVTRRDFLARATTFAAAAGLSAAAKPFFMDFLIKNSRAQAGCDLPPFTLLQSDRGGLPMTVMCYRDITGAEQPVQGLSFYKPSNQQVHQSVQNGRNLFLPPAFNSFTPQILQNVSTWLAMSGGPGGHPSVASSYLLSKGSEVDSLNVLLSKKEEGLQSQPVLAGVELAGNGETLSNNVAESAIFNPSRVNLHPQSVLPELQDTLSPVQLAQMNANEVGLMQSALNWVAEIFGNRSVNTRGVANAVASVTKGTELFTVDLAHLMVFDQDMLDAYGINDEVHSLPNPPPNFQPLRLGLLFAVTELLWKNNITSQVQAPWSSQDWHRVPNMSNSQEPVALMQAHFAEKLKVFIERMDNIMDPRCATGNEAIGSNMLIQCTSVQGRHELNDGGWADKNNLWSWIYHTSPTGKSRLAPGTFGDFKFDGTRQGVDLDASPLAPGVSTNTISFLHTLYDVLGVNKVLSASHPKIHGAIIPS